MLPLLPTYPPLPPPQASDEIGSLLVMTLKHKLRSFVFSPHTPKGCTGQLALGLANNSVEVRMWGLLLSARVAGRCCMFKTQVALCGVGE